jgi:simple sugar transport system substrate-binding protein
MIPRRKGLRAAALAAALVLGAAGCSQSGGKQEEQQASGNSGGGQVANTERFTIAMITHEAPGDTFWDKIRTGAKAAAAKDNIDLKYSNNNSGPQQATLIQNAVDSGVDAIAVTMAFTEAVRPAIKSAVDKGIPVVGFNQGLDQYQDYGALMYFGSDESLAGQSAGERIKQAGGKKALCIIQEQGSVALETRCAGVKKGFAETENLNVDGTQLPAVRSTIAAKLQQDKSVDYVVTLGAPFALAALDSVTDAGSQAKVVTFDLNAEAAKAIQDGKIEFSIDQQPYVQGYEAVDSLWLYLTNRNDLGGGKPVLTGPSFVDETNIEQIAEYAQRGTR